MEGFQPQNSIQHNVRQIMLDPFDAAVAFVLSAEGGLVDDASDPGGLTKFGISQRAYPNLNIRELTLDDAKALYRKDYWYPCSCDQLPGGVALIVFDAAVNQGVGRSIRMLQRSLNVPEDGVIGPVTLSAIAGRSPAEIIAEMIARRAVAYALSPLAGSDGLGWFRRLAKAHQIALRL
jgi:lysozyme family protein